jgi:hypothetical protein
MITMPSQSSGHHGGRLAASKLSAVATACQSWSAFSSSGMLIVTERDATAILSSRLQP